LVKNRRPYRARDRFPAEYLREDLVRKAGLSRDEHEARVLRTLLYSKRLMPREGASADEMAKLLLVSLQERRRARETYEEDESSRPAATAASSG
jgi:hypothetical protein